MKVLDRPVDSISIEPSSSKEGKFLLTIHGDGPQGNRIAFLTTNEMRFLAYNLLATAEKYSN